jgi:hypothetical protein
MKKNSEERAWKKSSNTERERVVEREITLAGIENYRYIFLLIHTTEVVKLHIP